MGLWMNLKVKTKALILVAVAVVTLAAIVATGLYKMSEMAADEKEMSLSVKHVGMLNDLKYDLASIRLNLVYMLSLEDPAVISAKAEDIEKRKPASAVFLVKRGIHMLYLEMKPGWPQKEENGSKEK